MAEQIAPFQAQLVREVTSLVNKGVKPRTVPKGEYIRLSHKYKSAYYGVLEKDGSAIWVPEDALRLTPEKGSKVPMVVNTDEEKHESDEEEESSSSSEEEDGDFLAVAQFAFNPVSLNIKQGLVLEKGDQVQVLRADADWSFGKSVRSGLSGIFPSKYVSTIETSSEVSEASEYKESHDDDFGELEHKHKQETKEYVADLSEGDSIAGQETGTLDENDVKEDQITKEQVEARTRDENNVNESLEDVSEINTAQEGEHSNVPRLSSLCSKILVENREDDLSKIVLLNVRRHCSRSFSAIMLRELCARRVNAKSQLENTESMLQHQMEQEHSILLNEIDRLENGSAIAELQSQNKALERTITKKDALIEEYAKRICDLQEQVTNLQNETWLYSELSFLNDQ